MSINLCGRRFSRPVRLAKWKPLRVPGVFALLVPGGCGFQAIYIGEAEDLSALAVNKRHPAYPCWLVIAGSADELYVSGLATWGLDAAGRKALASELVAAWRPFCNYEARQRL